MKTLNSKEINEKVYRFFPDFMNTNSLYAFFNVKDVDAFNYMFEALNLNQHYLLLHLSVVNYNDALQNDMVNYSN